MILSTPRLTLRPADVSLTASTYAYAGDLENTRLMMFLPDADEAETALHLREAEEQWRMDAPERYEFAIFLGETHIGGVTLYMMEDRTEAELGWVLHKDYWRKGYVTEAAQAVMEFARSLGVRRIFACCDSENVASYQLMLKLGMTLVKTDGVRTNRSMGDEPRVEWTCERYI